MIVRSQTRAKGARCTLQPRSARGCEGRLSGMRLRTGSMHTKPLAPHTVAAHAKPMSESAQPLPSPVRVACHHDGGAGARRRLPT